MKRIFRFTIIVFVIIITILPINSIVSQTPVNVKNKFSFGIVNWLLKTKYRNGNHPDWYTELTLDINLSYSGRDDNTGAYGQRSTYQAENQECNYSCK